MSGKSNGYDELLAYLEDGEVIDSLVLGRGWLGKEWVYEGKDPPYPDGVRLTLEEAEPHLRQWSWYGGFGGADCPPMICWTDRRVIFITEYDGATGLRSVPKFPPHGRVCNYKVDYY